MFYRFGGALFFLILIALAGIAIEKRSLAVRRAISHQQYRQEALLEQYAQSRLKTQQMGAPSRLWDELHGLELKNSNNRSPSARPQKSADILDERELH